MDDLGASDILVLRDAPGQPPCDVGIESTVVKVDAATKQLLLLRRGGVPEAELARWLARENSGFTLKVEPQKHKPPPPLPPDETSNVQVTKATAAATSKDSSSDGPGMLAPGMSLTHYAPDLPSFLVNAAASTDASPEPANVAQANARSYSIRAAVVLDYGARLGHLRDSCVAYRDLSPRADASEAAADVFEALRWAEQQATKGGRCVLLPIVADGRDTSDASEHAPALADRLFRAASGRKAAVFGQGNTSVITVAE